MKSIPNEKAEKFLKEKFLDETIDFKCYSFLPEESHEIWTQQVIEIYKNKTACGFIKIMYYDRDNILHPMDTSLDYFALLKSNKNYESWFSSQDEQFFHQFGYKNPVLEISEKYHQEHKEFMQLWDKKPTVELVRVYGEGDRKATYHCEYPPFSSEREPQNFKGQGIAKNLYLAAALLMKQNKMSIYSSFKQTQEGQNMWKSIEKNPQFILSCENLSKRMQGKSVTMTRSYFTA